MTSARLSPAANLLRNSKLFALPAAVPLPPARPSSEPFASSDTATTIYPTKAAIYTSSPALANGDWGLKRSLPSKAFSRTKTPTIRLRRDIDTQEHIADFDSAGDHVLTLQKWEENPVLMTTSRTSLRQKQQSVFSHTLDNTTLNAAAIHIPKPATRESKLVPWNEADREAYIGEGPAKPNTDIAFDDDVLHFERGFGDAMHEEPATSDVSTSRLSIQETLEQYKKDYAAELEANGQPPEPPRAAVQPVPAKLRRWRFNGPWIAGMTNFDFEKYLSEMDTSKVMAFRDHLKRVIVTQRETEHAVAVETAQENGVQAPSPPSLEVTNEEVVTHLRELRSKPNEFATQIAEYLDLPDGPKDISITSLQESWYYNRDQGMAETHKAFGPPKTHPSAGFSYLRSSRFATNDARRGPVEPAKVLPARLLKDTIGGYGASKTKAIGVGGFVVHPESATTTTADHSLGRGGPKMTAKINEATILNDGSVRMGANITSFRVDKQNVPIVDPEFHNKAQLPDGAKTLPELDTARRLDGRRTPTSRPTPLRYRTVNDTAAADKQQDDDYDDVMRLINSPGLRSREAKKTDV
jgi:hypothetical protein